MKQLLITICFHFCLVGFWPTILFGQNVTDYLKKNKITFQGVRLSQQSFIAFDSVQYQRFFNSAEFDCPVNVSEIPLSFGLSYIKQVYQDHSWQSLQPRISFNIEDYKRVKLLKAQAAAMAPESAIESRVNSFSVKRDSLYRILNNPSLIEIPSNATFSDSLLLIGSTKLETPFNPSIQDTARILRQQLYQKAFQEYQSVNDSIEKLLREKNSISEKGVVANLDSLKSPLNSEKQDSMPLQSISGFERFMTHFKSLAIGRTIIDNSILTVKEMPIVGASFEAMREGFYLSVASGHESIENQLFYSNVISVPAKINMVSAGIGDKSASHIHMSYTSFSDLPQLNYNSSIYSNQLISLDMKKADDKGNSVETNIASSLSDNSSNEIGVSTNPWSRMAVHSAFTYLMEDCHLNLSGSFLISGNGYSSYGNRYLLPGSKIADLRLNSSLSKKLSLEYKLNYFTQESISKIIGSDRLSQWLSGKYAIISTQSISGAIFHSVTQVKNITFNESSHTTLNTKGFSIGTLRTIEGLGGNMIFQLNASDVQNQTYLDNQRINQYSMYSMFVNAMYMKARTTIRFRMSTALTDYSTSIAYVNSIGAGLMYSISKKWQVDSGTDLSTNESHFMHTTCMASVCFMPNSHWRIIQQWISSMPLNNGGISSGVIDRSSYRLTMSLSI